MNTRHAKRLNIILYVTYGIIHLKNCLSKIQPTKNDCTLVLRFFFRFFFLRINKKITLLQLKPADFGKRCSWIGQKPIVAVCFFFFFFFFATLYIFGISSYPNYYPHPLLFSLHDYFLLSQIMTVALVFSIHNGEIMHMYLPVELPRQPLPPPSPTHTHTQMLFK